MRSDDALTQSRGRTDPQTRLHGQVRRRKGHPAHQGCDRIPPAPGYHQVRRVYAGQTEEGGFLHLRLRQRHAAHLGYAHRADRLRWAVLGNNKPLLLHDADRVRLPTGALPRREAHHHRRPQQRLSQQPPYLHSLRADAQNRSLLLWLHREDSPLQLLRNRVHLELYQQLPHRLPEEEARYSAAGVGEKSPRVYWSLSAGGTVWRQTPQFDLVLAFEGHQWRRRKELRWGVFFWLLLSAKRPIVFQASGRERQWMLRGQLQLQHLLSEGKDPAIWLHLWWICLYFGCILIEFLSESPISSEAWQSPIEKVGSAAHARFLATW